MSDADQRVGLYINTLPLRVRMAAEETIGVWLNDIQNGHIQAREYQYSALNQIQTWSGTKGDLFDSIIVFENYPMGEILSRDWSLKVANVQTQQQNNFLLSLVVGLGEKLTIKFSYNSSMLDASYVDRIQQHFLTAIEQLVIEEKASTSAVNILSASEQTQLFEEFNNTAYPYPKTKTVADLFAEQVAKTPDRIALTYQGKEWTYQSLHEVTDQLAIYLQKTYELQPDDFVGIMMERSEWAIISILGVLKAGAAYIPIELSYPDERKALMIEDTQLKALMIHSDHLFDVMEFNVPVFSIDIQMEEVKASVTDTDQLESAAHGDHLAYVMYTSGSTGKPKGVQIEHHSIARLIFNPDFAFLNEESVIYQYAPLAFDASTFELWGALLKGGKLVIANPGLKSIEAIAEDIQAEKINAMWLTAGLFHLAVDTCIELFSTLDYILAGGDVIHTESIHKLLNTYEGLTFINGYGPTESTTFAIVNHVETPAEIDLAVNNIGKPIGNTQIFILDGESLEAIPMGGVGEICIGGDGLARAYLNRPELTAEKFVDHPLRAGEKLYKTGDLGRWLPQGRIEFLGRRDNQVKIRGYRIELGEIEATLQKAPQVGQCIVLVKVDANANKSLVAYVVPEEGFNKEACQTFLQAQLPQYMVPSVMVELSEFPLTNNGKVDRRALLSLLEQEVEQKEYIAPRNATEKALAEIWGKLLSTDKVSIHDNFFELGGDSIITIQVVTRAKSQGYPLQPKDIFMYPTVATLAEFLQNHQRKQIVAEQGVLKNSAPLLPIQSWFFENDYPELDHFNQAVLLELDKQVDETVLETALRSLISHHDALRFNYQRKGENWKQRYGTYSGNLEVEDLSFLSAEQLSEQITALCEQYQQTLKLEEGLLIRTVLIKTPDSDTQNRLFIAIHHLAVDGVSWRILLDHLQQALDASSQQKEVQLGTKTSSYRDWAEALERFAHSPRITEQFAYWQHIADQYMALPVEGSAEKTLQKDVKSCQLELGKTLTKSLLHQVNRAYQTEINDILLAALAQTINEWTGSANLVLGMEGHGREELFPDLDTTSTVGWFTSLYPLALKVDSADSEAALIKSVKEQIRTIPTKGLGYGLLRYLHPSEEVREALAKTKWDVIFNYLGQLDNVTEDSTWFRPAGEHIGESFGAHYPYGGKLMVNSFVSEGKLMVSFDYSDQQYSAETIQQLGDQFISNLSRIIHHCTEKEQTEFTPSDFGLAPTVTTTELDQFFQTYQGVSAEHKISHLHRLSPLQEGMLFHHLYDPDSQAYTEQLIFDLSSEVDAAILQASWEILLQRYGILRTTFNFEDFSIPVQFVREKVSLPFEVKDWSDLSAEKQEEETRIFLSEDLKKGFDFSEPTLMRITLIKKSDTTHQMIWTFNHIILDGWSLPLLVGELLEIYETLGQEQEPETKAADNYGDYIQYLQTRDRHAEKDFWENYLKGFESPSLLPFIPKTPDRNRAVEQAKVIDLELPATFADQLRQYALDHNLTANTVVQGAWSFLLAKYTGNSDTAFGVIVAGRPTDLSNSEDRVGLYINMLPLRSQFQTDQAITEWLETIQQGHAAAREFQYTSLNDIQQLTKIQGDFFDTILTFENYPMGEVIGKEWSLKIDDVKSIGQTNYLLSVSAALGETMSMNFVYNADLLTADYVEEIKGHFAQVLEQIITQPQATLADIELLTEKEKKQIMQEFNPAPADYPTEATIVSLFEEQARERANAVALTFGAEQMTYKTLNTRANQLAHFLIDQGVGPDSLVAICLDRSLEMIIGLLGILKAGGAYVPIDPNYPTERISYILQDSQVKLMITDDTTPALASTLAGLETIDIHAAEIQAASSENPSIALRPEHLAYVIYTSGTTGKPKGVLLEHRNIVRLFKPEGALFDFDSNDVWTMFHSFCFDFSVWEMYGALLFGGRLVVVPKDITQDAIAYSELLEKEGVTILNQTPTAFYVLQEQVKQAQAKLQVRMVIFGGEALSPAQLQNWKDQFPACQLVNMYGITETTVHVTYKALQAEDMQAAISNIGQAIPTLGCYILDANQNLLPVGVTGEIYVTGAGLARGYLGRPELTAERFVDNPLVAGTKMYKTGDLGRWLPNGEMEYMGRADDQVKIRGYRIELGEIETVVQQHPEVKNAVVLAKGDSNTGQYLVAYIVPENTFDPEDIQQFLATQLPEYMVPPWMIEMENIPRTSNGKVDKKVLPEVDQMPITQTVYMAPENEVEQQLVEIWQNLLGLEKIGTKDDFFQIGGHSLLATRVVLAIRKEFQINIPLNILFEFTTIGELARYLRVLSVKKDPEDIGEYEVLDL